MNLEKLVCHCRKVSNGDIKTAVENGASTFEEVQEATNVAKGCRRCKENAERVMEEFISEQA
ncbi:MAG: (2Fe-2S)-binding protein [bacterium]|nr:(2Fe-2S)-binding protein [bacterium]